jgi:uncharacterized membrane protein
MGLHFCNSYRDHVWVAYMFWSPDACGGEGDNWQTIGWFGIAPGSCATVYANDLDDVNNRYWYFYSENDSRTYIWADNIPVYVTDEAFNHCIGIGTTTSRIVNYKQIDVGDYEDFTITLT